MIDGTYPSVGGCHITYIRIQNLANNEVFWKPGVVHRVPPRWFATIPIQNSSMNSTSLLVRVNGWKHVEYLGSVLRNSQTTWKGIRRQLVPLVLFEGESLGQEAQISNYLVEFLRKFNSLDCEARTRVSFQRTLTLWNRLWWVITHSPVCISWVWTNLACSEDGFVSEYVLFVNNWTYTFWLLCSWTIDVNAIHRKFAPNSGHRML